MRRDAATERSTRPIGDERVVERMPRHPSCASASTSPTTAPTSTGWSRQPGLRTVQGVLEDALATLFRAHGRRAAAHGRRSHRRRRARARPGRAPRPAARRRSRRSRDRVAAATRTRRPRRRWPGGSPASSAPTPTSSSRTPSARPPGSTPGSPRSGGATSTASPTPRAARDPLRAAPHALASRARSTSRRWMPRPRRWSACTTSPRSAGRARARRPSAPCRVLPVGAATTTACSSRRCRPTPSATRWCARSSGACVAVGEGRLDAGRPGRAAATRPSARAPSP